MLPRRLEGGGGGLPSRPNIAPLLASSGCALGTAPVIALAVLDAALNVWDGVEPREISAGLQLP